MFDFMRVDACAFPREVAAAVILLPGAGGSGSGQRSGMQPDASDGIGGSATSQPIFSDKVR